jgi:hypothetical protein
MDLSIVNPSASLQAKIALFRALFRGREDVYPGRGREPKGRRFLTVTDDMIRWHLSRRDEVCGCARPCG